MDVPGFRIISKLGSGAMGTVYLAIQLDLDRQVALKVLRDDPDEKLSLRRFQREAQAMSQMRHPGIVRLYSYQPDLLQPYLVMEYLPGGTLRDKLKAHPTGLEVAAVLRIGRDLLGALAELHAANVSHRDVKPANILYRASGEAVLGDLGLVSVTSNTDTQLTRPEVALGTIAYMAPETVTTGVMGPLGDLYAAGVTLYEALTGTHPTAFRPAASGVKFADPGTLRADAPRPLCELIVALTEADPVKRVQSASAALKLLSKSAASRPAKVPPTGPAARPPGVRSPRRTPALLVGACLATVLAALGVSAWKRHAAPAFEIRAGGRAVTVVARPAVADRLLCVYDGATPVASVQGDSSAGSTTFRVAGLRPHQDYRAQLLATGESAHAPIDLAFRTAVEVELLGLDVVGGGVWMRSTPASRLRWAGSVDWVSASAEPVRLAGRPRDLEIQLGSSAPAVVAVTTSVALDAGPLDLGLMVGADPAHEQVQDTTAPRPLMDWLEANAITWMVLPPDADGKPRVGLDFSAFPRAPRRIFSMQIPGAADRPAWLDEIRRAEVRSGPQSLALDAEWMYAAGMAAQNDDALAGEIRAWQVALGHRKSPEPGARSPEPDSRDANHGGGPDLLVPAPLGLLYLQFQTMPSQWLRALERLDAISIESLSDNSNWETDRAKLYRGLDSVKVRPDLKFIWALAAIRSELLSAPSAHDTADSVGLARCFAFARATYPGVTLIADLKEIGGPPPMRRPSPTWTRLIAVARALRGLRFRKYLGGATNGAPSVESATPIAALGFGGAARGVQVLCTDSRAARVRFTPARPGILRVPGPAEEPWAARVAPTTAPIDLNLTSAPLLYEELVRVEATTRTTGEIPLEVITR